MSVLTVTGNLTADPETRETASGTPFTTFTLVENSQYKNGAGEWVENPPNFWPVAVWGEHWAKHLRASLHKGDRVTVVGETRTNTWEDAETKKPRSRVELVGREVSASMRYASMVITRAQRADGPPAPVGAHASDAPPF